MWPFTCSLCKEKDSRISELKEQITYLRSVLNPPPRISTYEMESDHLMNGGGEQLDTPMSIEDEAKGQEELKQALIQLEQDQILSGTY